MHNITIQAIIILYSTHFRNCEFVSDEINSKNSVLDLCKSLISYPNYFEFVDCIQFYSVNDTSLYDDFTNNQFSRILLLDALLSFRMKIVIHLFISRLSLAIKHVANKNNVDKHIEISDRCIITLLDKKKLYRNNKTYPDFDYTTKGFSKKVGKVIKIDDSKLKTFRKMVTTSN